MVPRLYAPKKQMFFGSFYFTTKGVYKMKINKNMMVINETFTTNQENLYRLSNGTFLEKWCNHSHGQRDRKHFNSSKCHQKNKDILTMEEFLRSYINLPEEELKIYKNFSHDELKWSTDFSNVKGASFEDAKKYRKKIELFGYVIMKIINCHIGIQNI